MSDDKKASREKLSPPQTPPNENKKKMDGKSF